MKEKIYRLKDSAEFLNVSRTTLWRMINRGEINPPKIISLGVKGYLYSYLCEFASDDSSHQ